MQKPRRLEILRDFARRPPVPVVSPVSTRVTRQGSATELWTVMLLFTMSKVTSEVCRK